MESLWKRKKNSKKAIVELIISNKCNYEEFELFVMTSRTIWFRRNTVVYGKKILDLNLVLREAMDPLEEFKNANMVVNDMSKQRDEETQNIWKAPPTSLYKVN